MKLGFYKTDEWIIEVVSSTHNYIKLYHYENGKRSDTPHNIPPDLFETFYDNWVYFPEKDLKKEIIKLSLKND